MAPKVLRKSKHFSVTTVHIEVLITQYVVIRESGTVTENRDINELSTSELIEYVRTSVMTLQETLPAIVDGLRRLEDRCTEVIVQAMSFLKVYFEQFTDRNYAIKKIS
jgi:hypothetical protein